MCIPDCVQLQSCYFGHHYVQKHKINTYIFDETFRGDSELCDLPEKYHTAVCPSMWQLESVESLTVGACSGPACAYEIHMLALALYMTCDGTAKE